MADIRETGPVGLKGLKGVNQQKDVSQMSLEEQWKSINSIPRTAYSSAPEESVGLAAMQAGYGDSQYDEGITSASQFEDIEDIRYANQPWYDVLANGVGKMLGRAATTFASSLVGLPYGIGTAINEGRWSGLWDNDVTQGLSDVDKWFEDNLQNYQSQAQQQDPTFRLGDLNWWADNVIANAGFTLGAAASMAVGSGSLGLMSKALGFVNDVSKTTKGGAAFLSALFSATGEGMIEAKQGVEERNKLEMQKLDDAFAPEKAALEEEFNLVNQEYAATRGQSMVMGLDGKAVDPAYELYKQRMEDLNAKRDAMQQRYNAGKQEIEESGQRMGNLILGANQALLSAGNMIQFAKGMTKSFDAARHAAETASKAAKPFGVTATRVSNNIKDGYKVAGKNFAKAMVLPKNAVKEGSEEMNQQWIQSGAGAYYDEKDVNDYWKAKLDPEAYKETTEGLHTWGNAISQGFRESWGEKDQWEQFLIGAMTGMSGSYMPSKIFNQDKTKSRWNPQRYGEWSGGVWQDMQDFNRDYQQYQENIDDLNKILASEDFPARVRSMVGHTYTENEKVNAAEADDKKAWKDADDKQNIHDVQSFLRAGKLDDLKAIYNEISSTMSDEDVDNLVKNTTKEITAEEDKQNFDRQMDEQIAARQREVDSLYDELESLQNGLLGSVPEAYDANRDYVNTKSGELLSKINEGEQAIRDMENEKSSYVGQKYYEGAYVDRQGNKTITNDEIRDVVKHNAEELNRKLDSYLESIAAINEATNGRLTKDQEDNLAYLHNMGKESIVRMEKIMGGIRQQLPSKFLLKTDKSPEQLTKESTNSDLVFTKDENTKEGYVEVDTSLMTDKSFATFFQREIMRGGNIRPEFAETADERAAREEDEKNLPEEERKKKARERASKKWQDSVTQALKDRGEQQNANWKLIVNNFENNYRRDNNASLNDTANAFAGIAKDLKDSIELYEQAGVYYQTLDRYMQNPSLVDKDKEKEENKAQKAEAEQQAKNKFEGKDARQMKQELADGALDFDDFSNFADMDLSGDAPAPLRSAQQEARKAQEGMQKAASLKNHIQEQLGDNPTQEELNAAQLAMQMVDQAGLAADNPSDISIDMPELSQVPLDAIDPNASIEDIDNLTQDVQNMLADAFTAFEEDRNAQNDIPESVPSDALDDVDMPTTGHDETAKMPAETVAPTVSSSSKAAQTVVPKNPLTEGAIDNIITETAKSTNTSNNGVWRCCTTRNPYGRSTGTYHDNVLANKDSKEYRRSKTIWEYLNAAGAFDREDNSSADRIKAKDTIHFMVKYLPDVYGKEDFKELTEEERPYALVIIMLNDNGEILGDLPLAELEPSFKAGNPNSQVQDLMNLQKKVFDAFTAKKQNSTANEMVVDDIQVDGADNLNLTFDGTKKPLVSRVKQVMRGSVPYRKSEKNTLNDVANGQMFELAVKVTGTNAAIKRGDKALHKDIVLPSVGTTGQPYLLLPTPSGEKIAVPFYMPAFDAEKHRNTELYRQLSNALLNIMTTTANSKENIESFGRNMDVVEGLLQVKRQEGAKRVLEVDSRNNRVVMHLQSLTDPNAKIDLIVPYNDNYEEVAKSLADALSGTHINVSLQFLNDKIETSTGEGKTRKAWYNQVIGEIADVNLPKATNHTVNGWFTVELAPSAGMKASKKVTTRTTGTFVENVGGRNIEFDADKLIAVDTATGEIIEGNEDINLRLAQIKASKPQYRDKDRIQISVDGVLRTYDVKNNKFVRNSTTPAENAESYINKVKNAKTSQELIDILNKASEDNANGTLSANDLIKVNSAVNAKRAALATETPDVSDIVPPKSGIVGFGNPAAHKLTLVHPETKIVNNVSKTKGAKTVVVESMDDKDPEIVLYDKNFLPVARFPYTEELYRKYVPAPEGKTIEQIEEEAKKKRIVTRQTKDAWAAIPNELKLKLFNEGASLSLHYREGYPAQMISLSNMGNMIRVLTDTNMAAKAGTLKVSEVAKPMEQNGIALSRENERAARRWLAQNLPMLSSEERTQFVDKVSRMGDNAGKYWGSYRSGVIEIQRNAPMGATYHEAFHYVLDIVLSPEERRQILDLAKNEYNVNDDWTAEERLAEDFRRFAMDENAEGIVGRLKRWFRNLMDKIKRYNRISDTTVNQLFWKINNGELAQKSVTIEDFDETQQRVLREIRNVQNEKYSWRNLNADTKAALKSSGLSEAAYNEMSLEEKEQYVKCRG